MKVEIDAVYTELMTVIIGANPEPAVNVTRVGDGGRRRKRRRRRRREAGDWLSFHSEAFHRRSSSVD